MSLFRNRLLKTVTEKLLETIIRPAAAQAGDVCLYDASQDKLIIVSIDNISYFTSSNYSPVGVVVVPGSHNVYGDGSCGIMSIVPMNCTTPTTGGTSERSMYWGVNGTDISSLPNLNQVPYVGTGSSVGDSTSTILGQTDGPRLPSDKFSAVQCPHDTDTYYLNSSEWNYQAPSPFLTDGSRNPAYYQTSSPSSTSNAMSDFDGVGNTDKIITQRGTKNYTSWKPSYSTETDYPAASCCDMYYTNGTKQGDWYLPACGELGYIMPNFNKINTTISTLKNAYSIGVELSNSSDYWSSSEFSINRARLVYVNNGGIYNNDKYSSSLVRAFLRVKSNDRLENNISGNLVENIRADYPVTSRVEVVFEDGNNVHLLEFNIGDSNATKISDNGAFGPSIAGEVTSVTPAEDDTYIYTY